MSLTKEEHISHWTRQASRDWETVLTLFNSKQYMFSLFVSHLVIEKLLKANWVKDNEENIPPMSHNLENLADQTDLELSNDEIDFIRIINAWNIEGRYQDYKDNFYKRSTKKYVGQKLKELDKLRECLQKRLP